MRPALPLPQTSGFPIDPAQARRLHHKRRKFLQTTPRDKVRSDSRSAAGSTRQKETRGFAFAEFLETASPWAAPRDPSERNTGEPFLVRTTRVGRMTERRRRERRIAWGVSPRYRLSQHHEAPEGGRQIAVAASAAISLLSVAASRLEVLFPCRIPGADAPGYGYTAASRLRVSGFALWASPRQVAPRCDTSRLVRAITKKRGKYLERTA